MQNYIVENPFKSLITGKCDTFFQIIKNDSMIAAKWNKLTEKKHFYHIEHIVKKIYLKGLSAIRQVW